MILATDVAYDEEAGTALAAGVAFVGWGAPRAAVERTVRVQGIQPYEPGAFYKRELPCLRALLAAAGPVDVVVVDGYVDLGPDHHGLGWHLYEALEHRVPVVGIAKTRFAGATPIEVLRGSSKNPLFVTAVGLDAAEVAEAVRTMHGPHRLPTLLQRVDALSRGR